MSLRQNALLLALLAALIAVAGEWGGDAALERWWRAPLGLLLLGLAYEAVIARRARPRLSLQAVPRWLLSRPTPLRLELAGPLRRPLRAEIALSGPPEVALTRTVLPVALAASGSAVIETSATARRLGQYDWPPLRARLGGVLGLAWWNTTLAAAFRLQVVPDALRARERALGAAAGGAHATARTGAGGEILQLRDYRPEDAPRVIDWKASRAAAGSLPATTRRISTSRS